jgi:glycosyltransferase involved in cell wall biosynthesis
MMTKGYSVVVPAFNEGRDLNAALEQILSRLERSRYPKPYELIVVDDGSSDCSPALLDEFAAQHAGVLRVVRHAQNAGLTAAMRTGAEAATFDTVVFLDADLSYAPEIVEALLEAKSSSGASVALASPYMRGGHNANVPFDRLAASVVANWILSVYSGGRLSTFTGMVRAYDTETLRKLFERPVVGEFNSWALATLIAEDNPVVEVPATLAWPPERREGARRMRLSSFISRTWDVVVSAEYLASACRRSKKLKTGTLVLRFQPTRP